jgi:hypothetical protein
MEDAFASSSRLQAAGLIFKFLACCLLLGGILIADYNVFAAEGKSGIVINGDDVEFSTDSQEFTAKGNVEVLYKGAKLTCDKLVVNTQTKDGVAEGHVRLDDKGGVIEGEKMTYNFDEKKGILYDGWFRATPYFGKGEKVEKVNEAEFMAMRGYFTTCSLNNPHWRMKTRKMRFFPGNKLITKDDTVYFGGVPAAYLPQYSHSLRDPLMHVQITPGKSKFWGLYTLTAWRYKLTEHISGRIYADYRSKLGVAQGFGANYAPPSFGKGDFKFYYTQERDHTLPKANNAVRKFQRYFIRNRYKWDIDEQTNLTSEYYKIIDSKREVPSRNTTYNILKDYFFREYEKDAQPLSYLLLHRSFEYASLDALVQKRTSRWYAMTEKLPEVTFSMASLQLGETPFYISNTSVFSSQNQKAAVPSPSTDDVNLNRFDTTNKLSLPSKVAFFTFTPFVSNQEIFDDKWANASSAWHKPVSVFSSGADLSTKFYRLFNVTSGLLGMEINGLRHIITPGVGYAYQHEPTVPSSKLKFSGASAVSNAASLSLSNKLQTKREGIKVDFVDFLVENTYNFKTGASNKAKSRLADFLYKLHLLPYSWMSIYGTAKFQHSGSRQDVNYKHLSELNYDINLNLAAERTFSFSQRYQRKGSHQFTYSLNYRLNPKWRFAFYQRYERGHDTSLKRGLREQEYTIVRDLHCWTMELNYNLTMMKGESIWLIFRLKAFPELEFNYNQTYHVPRQGAQE